MRIEYAQAPTSIQDSNGKIISIGKGDFVAYEANGQIIGINKKIGNETLKIRYTYHRDGAVRTDLKVLQSNGEQVNLTQNIPQEMLLSFLMCQIVLICKELEQLKMF